MRQAGGHRGGHSCGNPCKRLILLPDTLKADTPRDRVSGGLRYRDGMSLAHTDLNGRTLCPDSVNLTGGGHIPPSLEGGCPPVRPPDRTVDLKKEIEASMKASLKTEHPWPDDGLLPSPRDCMRVRGTGRTCEACHALPPVLHVPTRQRGEGACDLHGSLSRTARGHVRERAQRHLMPRGNDESTI